MLCWVLHVKQIDCSKIIRPNSYEASYGVKAKRTGDKICELTEYWSRLLSIWSSENTWSACKMLTNSCLNNSFPLTNCSGSISSSVESENKPSAWQEQISNPSTCILAKHISNPNCWWDAGSRENQYILLDASIGSFNSGMFFDRREMSFASSSWALSRLNHSVSVSLSPSIICERKPIN